MTSAVTKGLPSRSPPIQEPIAIERRAAEVFLAEATGVERLQTGQGLRRERLVQLDQLHPLEAQAPGAAKSARRGEHRAQSHARRIATGEGPRAHPAQRRQAELARAPLRCENQGRRSVRDL